MRIVSRNVLDFMADINSNEFPNKKEGGGPGSSRHKLFTWNHSHDIHTTITVPTMKSMYIGVKKGDIAKTKETNAMSLETSNSANLSNVK